MSDVRDEVCALLEVYAGGPTPPPPSIEVIKAGRRQRARRRGSIVGIALAVAAVITAGSIVVTDNTGSTHDKFAVEQPVVQPTARQLANGHWVRIPKAPVELCDPLTVSDGTGVIVVEDGLNQRCPRAAERYDAASDSWSTMAAPLQGTGGPPTLAWGGNQLVSVNTTGGTFVWTPASNRWTQVERLPTPSLATRSIQSLTWTGSKFDAIRIDNGVVHAFSLDSAGSWSSLPTLQIAHGQRALEAAAVYTGNRLYALVSIDLNGRGNHSMIYRLDASGWHPLSLTFASLPVSELRLSATSGPLIAYGSGCPALGPPCPIDVDLATVIRLASPVRAIGIRPTATRPMPPPADVAIGGRTVYASYADGTGPNGLPTPNLPTGEAYDLSTGQWLRVPANAAVKGTSATWTSSGVVVLGGSQGWLLKPRAPSDPSRSTSSAATGLGSLICRPLPASYAAHQPAPTETRLTSSIRLHTFKVTLSPAPVGYQPAVSAVTVFSNSGINRTPGVRFSIFLARVTSTHPHPDRYSPAFHGQVLWVLRTFKTNDPYAGLPPPITQDDRECAGLRPPISLVSPVTGRPLITGN